MKFLLFFLLAFLLAAYAASFLIADSGYVVLALESWTVQIRFGAFVVLAAALFVFLYALFRVLAHFRRAPRRAAEWRERRALSRAHADVQAGYADLIGGSWARAEKKLAGAAQRSPTPLLAHLAAAYAAQQQGAFERRDEYFAHAAKAEPRRRVAILLTRLRMQAQAGQFAEAEETLRHLRAQAPRNPQVRRLAVELGRRTGNWKEALELLPGLRASAKQDAALGEAWDECELEAAGALFAECLDARRLTAVWGGLNNAQRRNPKIIAAYARRLLAFTDDANAAARAEEILRLALRQKWDADLVALYGITPAPDAVRQYRTAETWANAHPTDPALLLALGRLARRNQLWGKARSYLELAAEDNANTEAARELGGLLEELGDKERALACYRAALGGGTPAAVRAGD